VTNGVQGKDYVAKWLSFQSLWVLKVEGLVAEIKHVHTSFDATEMQKEFGVFYEQVQARVNTWQGVICRDSGGARKRHADSQDLKLKSHNEKILFAH